jgi:hypothetical protein
MTSRPRRWAVLAINHSFLEAKKRLARRWLTALVYRYGLDYPRGTHGLFDPSKRRRGN